LTARIIGLFGGSFDPPHLGHLALARTALARRLVDQVWFVPVGQPVHRRLSGAADGTLRAQWLSHMIQGEANMRVWDWEVRQARPVPAIETLRRFAQAWPRHRAVWLMGADALAGLAGWVAYPAHRRYCDLLVFARAGHALPALPDWREVDAHAWRACRGYGHVLYVRDAHLPDISATEVRRRLRDEQQVRGMVDPRLEQALYRRYGRQEGEDVDTEQHEVARLTDAVVAALEDKKAQDVLIIDVRGRCDFADRFIIASGRSDRQLKALAQAVSEVAHRHALSARIEGLEAMEWLLVDLGDVVVHLFLPEVRASFQLEHLWAEPRGARAGGA